MKKIISLLLSAQAALLLTATAVLFSSCVIVGTDKDPDFVVEKRKTVTVKETGESSTPSTTTTNTTQNSKKHSVTCYNDTSYIITDWCVKKDNLVTFANSTNNREIPSGGKDTIANLLEGRYKIFFSFDDCYQLQPCNYTGSEEFELNTDITYILSERTISYPACRTAESEEPVFVLKGSDGSEIELVKE